MGKDIIAFHSIMSKYMKLSIGVWKFINVYEAFTLTNFNEYI